MKLMKAYSISVLVFFIFSVHSLAQVNIGADHAPARGAILQIKDTEPADPMVDNTTSKKGGLGLPRVALVNATTLEPFIKVADHTDKIKALHIGTVVYNIATVGNDLIPGTYMWNGTRWTRGATRSSEFWLNVTDKKFVFPSGLVPADPIVSATLDVTWAPDDRACDLSMTAKEGGGILGFAPGSATSIGGAADFTITPQAMTLAEVGAEPFLEKMSVFAIEISDGSGGVKEEKIELRQINYNLIIEDKITYPIIGHNTRIKVLANTDWTVSLSDPSNIVESYTPTSGGSNTEGVTFTYKLKDNVSIDKKKATFTFSSTAGLFNDVVYEIEAMPNLPNSYMVLPGGNVTIPVMKAIAMWEDELKRPLDLTKPISLKVIWQEEADDLISNITLVPGAEAKYSNISIATANKIGNASIAYIVDDAIAWTWHLWITDYNPNSAAPSIPNGSSGATAVTGGDIWTYYNGYTSTTFMDRDYGVSPTITVPSLDVANRRGFVYEWGRKDPLMKQYYTYYHPDGTTTIMDATVKKYAHLKEAPVEGVPVEQYLGFNNNLAYSIHNPYTHIIGMGRMGYDWYSFEDDVENLHMWTTVDGLKGKYDPCPQGWRIPESGPSQKSPWYGLPNNMVGQVADFTAEGAGMYYSGFGINGTDGTLGIGVRMLTASPIGTRNYIFNFGASTFNASDNYARVHSHQIRCVKE